MAGFPIAAGLRRVGKVVYLYNIVDFLQVFDNAGYRRFGYAVAQGYIILVFPQQIARKGRNSYRFVYAYVFIFHWDIIADGKKVYYGQFAGELTYKIFVDT
nr:MAG: hypothetical protein [Bacteriophage sp.]